MSPSIDFSQVEDLKPIPEGVYLATVTAAKAGKSKAGNDKIDITWKVEEGEFEGRNIFDTMTFTEKSMYRVKATLLGLGFDETFSGEIVPDDLVGKTASIVVTIEQNEGQVDPDTGEPYSPRNRVKKVKPVSAATGGKTNLSKLLG